MARRIAGFTCTVSKPSFLQRSTCKVAYCVNPRVRYCTATFSNTTMSIGNDKLWLDTFAFRQFDDATYSGTKVPMSKEQFMQHVFAYYDEQLASGAQVLVDGYAPFCKHIFMPNCSDLILQGELRIMPENRHLLHSSYEARNDNELAVLTRYFPKEKVQVPPAKYLDLICTLCSRTCSVHATHTHPQTLTSTRSIFARADAQRKRSNGQRRLELSARTCAMASHSDQGPRSGHRIADDADHDDA